MTYRIRTLFIVIITAASITLLGLTNSSTIRLSNGVVIELVGPAEFIQAENSVVIQKLDSPGSSITILTSGNRSGDVRFEPIHVPDGFMYTTEVRDDADNLIARIDLEPSGHLETEVWFEFGENLSSGLVEGAEALALGDDWTGESATVDIQGRTLLGTVHSAGLAWAETWHWRWIEEQWVLVYDPEDTAFDFATDDSDKRHPFRYVGIAIPKEISSQMSIARFDASLRTIGNRGIHDPS